MRNTILFLLLTASLTGLSATPSGLKGRQPIVARSILILPASSVERDASSVPLEVYGRTRNFVLADNAPGLAGTRITIEPGVPVYVAWLARPEVAARVRLVAPFLFEDGRAALVQLDDAAAHKARLAGAELVRLPDTPYPFYRAQDRVYPRVALLDTSVQRLVAKVSPDSIRGRIQRMQDFRTRYTLTDSCRRAEQYVYDYFQSLGLDSVALDTWPWQGDTCPRNAIGIRFGRLHPDKYVLICGHIDSESQDHWNLAPGAEDNASGTAMALEAARVLAGENLDVTTIFIAFTGEEQGLNGSFDFARRMRERNADIIAALDFDMIAWPGGSFGVAIHCDSASYGLGEFEGRMADIYTSLDHGVDLEGYGSDQLSFQNFGYQSTAGAEFGDFYPYYHTTGDTIGNCSMSLAAEVAKMGIAALVTIAGAPAPPDSFALRDAGSGGTLDASWRENTEPDIAGYKLLWGTASRVYADSATVGRVNSHPIPGLQNGTRYYATVVAFDSAGHEGFPATEVSAIPGVVPSPPVGAAALPFYHGMLITWLANTELDLAGYNVYRSTTSGSGYTKLNPALLPDTTFRDSGLLSDTTYYYVVTALDTSDNMSWFSAEVRGKPVTLDHGILLVDETRNGTGRPGSPSDEQQDAFYHALLRGFGYTDWHVAESGVPLAGDIGPYSTIVWYADDFTQQLVGLAVPGLANYLAQGGRLWYMGWKPVVGLYGGGNSHYPYTFAPEDFAYERLHLSGAGECPTYTFTGASGAGGYPGVVGDSLKMIASQHGRLPAVDVLYPRDAEVVLTFNSSSGDSFQNKPVGVRWLGGTGRIVFLGFPLYYMEDEGARQLALKVMDDLGEPYGIVEGTMDKALGTKQLPTIVRDVLRLPVSPFTIHTSLFDMAGRQVMALRPGPNDVSKLATGVYFIREQSLISNQHSGPTGVRKVIVQR